MRDVLRRATKEDEMGLRVRASRSVRFDRLLAIVSLSAAVAIGCAFSAERSSAAVGGETIVFVVDTSTSFAGKPLADAKGAIVGASTAIAVDTQVGLRSFGGGCDNGGLVRLPVGPFDRPTFTSAVNSLAIGESGTPTPAALQATARSLPAVGSRTIVLVSDGGSSCGSPCPVARELDARLGAGFRIDTVGFRAPNFAESELDCVARVTGGSYVSVTDAAGLQKTLAESAVPRVTGLRVSPKMFRAAAKGGSIAGVVRPKVGARVSYSISKAGKVRFTIERVAAGRVSGGRCSRPTAQNSSGRICARYVTLLGSFGQVARQGENRFKFAGRLRGRKLAPGRYRLVATATGTLGNKAKPTTARFVVTSR